MELLRKYKIFSSLVSQKHCNFVRKPQNVIFNTINLAKHLNHIRCTKNITVINLPPTCTFLLWRNA